MERPAGLEELDEGNEPGRRSGSGAGSLWLHLAQDQQRKEVTSTNIGFLDRQKYCVLVVNDNAAARYAVGRTLSQVGYQIAEAAGGAEALHLAAGASIVILDVHLPDLHGMEVCRILRREPQTASLPIIHMSSVFVSPEDREAGAGAGADAYLVSPIPPDDLIQAVDLILSRALADKRLR